MTTDPITLAREVLETAHEDDTITVCSVPDNKAAALARAVLAVAALAETWEEAARLVEALGGDAETVRDLLQDIRAALNGGDA